MKILEFDLDEVNKTTYYQSRRFNDLRSRIEKAVADLDKKERLKDQECQVCFYLDNNALAGQAFTHYTCRACGIELINPNTNVNALCLDCAKKHKLCIHCGADLDLGNRRKL